jgi:RNA polymerase sigma-70 factor (ECF subfamily)
MNDGDLLQAGFRYAFALTHNHHDAEDLVQEAWVKLCASRGGVQSKSLLFVTLHNLFIDQYRRKKLVVIESWGERRDPPHNGALLETLIELRDVDAALSELRDQEREAVFLHLVEGYSAQEIAKITDRSRNTVLSLLHRGKQKILRYFNQVTGGDRHRA